MARERYQYAARQRAFRNPQDVQRDKFYEDEIQHYEGETLTIESITVGLWDNNVSAFVRFDADTAFSIGIGEKAEWQLFTSAGYALPCRTTHEKGVYPFHAEVICEWRKALYGRDWSLHVKFVESKVETAMEVPQPATETSNRNRANCSRDTRHRCTY